MIGFGAGVGVNSAVWDGGEGVTASSSFTESAEFQVLQETWDLAHDEYVEGDQVDDQELIYGASRGMIDALGDTGHSRFLDPTQTQAYEDSLRGEIVGIGVYVDFRSGLPEVTVPIDGSPADLAGISSGDVIVQIDGRNTDGLDPTEVTQTLRGEEGTTVTVAVERPGEPDTLTFDLVRARITVEPVSWGMLPENVAHIRLSQFMAGATDGIQAALEESRALGATGIVLDMRDNPGGLVFEAIGVASEFLPEGSVIFQERDQDGETKAVETVGGESAVDLPLVVLVNGNSASAAEIVAGALRDNGRATLLGERTYGTGTVLTPFQLDDGSTVLLGVALWLTADGEQIWKVGVEPDETVELPVGTYPTRPAEDPEVTPRELRASEDLQLQAAFEAVTTAASTP